MKNICSCCGKEFGWEDQEHRVIENNQTMLLCDECFGKSEFEGQRKTSEKKI